jgi:hypothetical protein
VARPQPSTWSQRRRSIRRSSSSALALPQVEREAARSLVARNLENYLTLRRVSIPAETEPAFSYRPPLPRIANAGTRAADRAASPATAAMRAGRRATNDVTAIDDLAFEPVTTLARLIGSKRVSSMELTRMYLARLAQHDPTLHCVVTRTEAIALAQAAEADAEIRSGRYRGPLHGIPYGIKDLFAVKGVPTTWGAQPYANQVPGRRVHPCAACTHAAWCSG